jgi:glycosyltransferase involved in cell wall biosynthesis
MLSDVPLVSIVTPTFNAGRFLKESIESVLGQDYPNIEYLVVDSHSTDDTQDILRRYAGRLRTIHAERLGPASAIHTGLSQARGSILAWLNADDRYEPGAVRSAVAAFLEQPNADIVYGDAWWIDHNGAVIRPYPTTPFEPKALERCCFISQPAAFFRASAYHECSLDPSLSVSFDYDLWIRLTKSSRRFKYLPQRLASSRMHRECLTLSQRREVFEVTMALLKKHYGYIPLSWIFGYLSYRRDGRDQFFEPLQYRASVFAASLPFGIAANRTEPLRVVRDWASTMGRGVRQRFARLAVARRTLLTEPPASEVQPTAASRRV